ncbi:hypothetical protein STEG23_034117 [Scotinomys teguina]
MSRHQCKNTGNNTKTYMTPSKPMDSPTAGPEHTNAEEAEFITKNDLQKVTALIIFLITVAKYQKRSILMPEGLLQLVVYGDVHHHISVMVKTWYQKQEEFHASELAGQCQYNGPPADICEYHSLSFTLLHAKMGRRQCKSAYNIIKNKTTPESSPPPTPKSDYCNADKAEENDLKKSLMKMLEEAFEEKMKNVSKEIGKTQTKNWRKSIKKLKKRKAKNWRK